MNMNKLINEIDKYVKKAPALPVNIKNVLVQIAPWAAIISVVLSLPTLLSIFGISSYMSVYGYGFVHWGMRYTVMIVFLIANLVLRGLSIQGLFAKSIKGWNLFFYSIVLYFVYSVFNLDLAGGIISTLISLYLLFQIKEYYK